MTKNWNRWLRKGFWAVTDQGLYAMSNFLVNIMLARWLRPEDYGAFTIAFTVFLLVGSFHSALLTEPMLVFGPGKYQKRMSEYLGVLVTGHSGLVIISGVLLTMIGVGLRVWGASPLRPAFIDLALASPFILLLWLMRRACYLRLDPRLAASGGLLYMLMVIGGLFVSYRGHWLNTGSALGIMGIASLLTSAWLWVCLHVARPPLKVNTFVRATLTDHWGYGRWAAATMALTWVPANVYYLFLPIWRGLESSAALKTVMNLIMPALNINTALSVLLVPALVRARSDTGSMRRLTNLVLALLTAGSIAYWTLLMLFQRPVMNFMYGPTYLEHLDQMWLLGLIVLVSTGVVNVLGGSLRSIERPDQVFRANVLSTVVALTVGLWSTFAWGVWGAAAGLALASAVRAVAIWRYYRDATWASSPQRAEDVAPAPTL